MGNFEESPPESIWESIVQKLDNKRKKKVILLVFRIAAGMAILVSTGMGLYLLNRTADEPKISVVADIKPEKGPVFNNNNGVSEPLVMAKNGVNEPRVMAKNEVNEPLFTKSDNEARKPDMSDSNESVYGEISQFANVYSENDEKDISYLVQIDHMSVPFVSLDSLVRDIDFNDMPSDTVLSAEEAASRLLAQYYGEEITDEDRQQRWSLGSEIAPLYSYRSINSENSDQMNARRIEDFNDSENGILAYAGGIRVGFSTNKRITIQSGIYYSRYGQEKSGVQPIANESSDKSGFQFLAVSNSTGTITGVIDEKNSRQSSYNSLDVISQEDYTSGIVNSEFRPLVQGNVENVSLKQYFDYLEFPLIMKYKIIDRKLDFNFSGGLITNFLIGKPVNVVSDGKATRFTETGDINKVNYQGSLGIGMEYPIKANFALTVEPRFRYYINSIDKSSSTISVHPFSFGFFAGVSYRF